MSDALNEKETQKLIDANPHLGIIDRHAESVSKAKLVLIVLCMIAIIASFVWSRFELNDTNGRIAKVESPCLRYGSNSQQCHESFRAAIDSITDYQLCRLLSKRPDLTNVNEADCVRIAREVRKRDEAATANRRSNAQPGRRSPDSQSPVPAGSNPPAGSNAPKGDGGSQSPGSGHHPGSPGSGHTPASPPPPGSPTAPSPAGSSEPTNPPSQSASSAAPSSPSAPESSSKPSSVVEVEAPGLPVQACVPGVLGVNCSR